MSAQELIDAWGAKHYPKYAGKTFRLDMEKRSGGYCETCWYEYECVVVRAGGKVVTEIERSLHELLMEIMDGK